MSYSPPHHHPAAATVIHMRLFEIRRYMGNGRKIGLNRIISKSIRPTKVGYKYKIEYKTTRQTDRQAS